MKLEALIWDVDGTLVDSEEVHRWAFNQAFAASDLDWHWSRERYAELLGVTGGKERIAYHGQSLGMEVDPHWVRTVHERKGKFYQRDLRAGVLAPRPGVSRVLAEAASRGLRLAIATSSSESNVRSLLESVPLGGVEWETVVAGDQVSAKKPAPDVYLEALRRLDLEPGQCLAMEDSEAGLRSAMAAGIPTVVIRSNYTMYHRFRGALVTLRSLDGDPNPLGLPPQPVTVDYLRAWHAAAG